MDKQIYQYSEDLFLFGEVLKKQTNFDYKLLTTWDSYMKSGFFRYSVHNSPNTRIIPGKIGYIAQLQTNRATLRRQPQSMTNLKQMFDSTRFNFSKINEEQELIFEIKKTDRELNDGRDLLIINNSPLDVGHCLLVPQVEKCSNQVLTEYSILLALETTLMSGSNLKLAFNSLCAYASVNHLHWHVYYTQYLLPLQRFWTRRWHSA
jgi:GDP-D-glucose phosphorylase